jgi:hypothetical protein
MQQLRFGLQWYAIEKNLEIKIEGTMTRDILAFIYPLQY